MSPSAIALPDRRRAHAAVAAVRAARPAPPARTPARPRSRRRAAGVPSRPRPNALSGPISRNRMSSAPCSIARKSSADSSATSDVNVSGATVSTPVARSSSTRSSRLVRYATRTSGRSTCTGDGCSVTMPLASPRAAARVLQRIDQMAVAQVHAVEHAERDRRRPSGGVVRQFFARKQHAHKGSRRRRRGSQIGAVTRSARRQAGPC